VRASASGDDHDGLVFGTDVEGEEMRESGEERERRERAI
jgi:hypothetical protein